VVKLINDISLDRPHCQNYNTTFNSSHYLYVPPAWNAWCIAPGLRPICKSASLGKRNYYTILFSR